MAHKPHLVSHCSQHLALHLSFWANCMCCQLNWKPWQHAHLSHAGQSYTEKYVQLKRSPKYRCWNTWNCFFQNIFKYKYAHRHCDVKIAVSAIKERYMPSATILMLLSKKLQTKITSHRYAHFVVYYIFFFTLICFNNYALFWHFESFPWHSVYYLICITICHWKCACSKVRSEVTRNWAFFLLIHFGFMKTSFLAAQSSWQQIAVVNVW